MNISIIFGSVLIPQLIRRRMLFQINKENRKMENGRGGFWQKCLLPCRHSAPLCRHGRVVLPCRARCRPPPLSLPCWISGAPSPAPCSLLSLPVSPPETLTLASLCRHGHRRPSSPRRRLKPPRSQPKQPPSPRRLLLPPRARNRSGVTGVAASVHVFAAAGRARRGPSRRRRSPSAVSDHGNVLGVSWTTSPCLLPSRLRRRSTPRCSLASGRRRASRRRCSGGIPVEPRPPMGSPRRVGPSRATG